MTHGALQLVMATWFSAAEAVESTLFRKPTATVHPIGSTRRIIPVHNPQSFQANQSNAQDGVDAVLAALASYESHAKGKTVKL